MRKVGRWIVFVGLLIAIAGFVGDFRVVRDSVPSVEAGGGPVDIISSGCIPQEQVAVFRAECVVLASDAGYENGFITPKNITTGGSILCDPGLRWWYCYGVGKR